MLGIYLDVTQLCRLLWSISAVLGAFGGFQLPTSFGTAGDAFTNVFTACFVVAISMDIVRLALFRNYLSPSYVALRIGFPVVQIPPVVRTGSNISRCACLRTCLTPAAVAGGAIGFSVFLASPWPIVVVAGATAAHALVLLTPCFGQILYWRTYYASLHRAGFEEWFCSAEDAAAAVLLNADPESTVLIAGTGASELPILLARRGHSVVAVDASEVVIEHMQSRRECVDWQCGDVTRLDGFPSASFDCVVDKGTFAALKEHSVEAYVDGFAAAHRLLKPGGCLVTIALAAIPPRSLSTAGFDLRSPSYRARAVSPGKLRGTCLAPQSVYVQVAVKRGSCWRCHLTVSSSACT